MNRKQIKREITIKTNYLLTNLNKMSMKKVYLILAAAVGMTITSCTTNDYLGDVNNDQAINDGSIKFGLKFQNMTRADEFVGATAADKLGGMFVVEGTKGSEQTNSPSTTVVFDNYLVGYEANSAGKTEENTNNWEYVGLQSGITGKLSGDTWTALHPAGDNIAATQSIKYWDYTQDQYDFIAWSTGARQAVTVAPTKGSTIKVTRINTGTTLASNAFKMTALSAEDLQQCYYTDINTVLKANYGQPVTLTFKNMAAKVRVALYETIPGYSVKDVYFYTSDAAPAAPTDLGYATDNTLTAATLFTMGTGVSLPQSGEVTVMYPHMGTANRGRETTDATYPTPTMDYNKASVTVTAADGGDKSTTQAFGELTAQYRDETGSEPTGKYLGTTLPTATFAGDKTKDFYTAVIPNTNAVPLTLRLDYTLVATDGSDEEIHVYGAKAVVPSTYTVWQPNYAYTYIFKISDNTNGWTSTTYTDPAGLFPITFDAVVTSFTDFNAEQTTVTTVATPSITTYQQGHTKATNEYSKSQTAGVSSDKKDVYVQVMDNSGATPSLKTDLSTAGKSLLYKVSREASEAEVMDALKNHTADYLYNAASPVGRNGITLTGMQSYISNTETEIVNGVDDQPITKININGTPTTITAGMVAKIDIDNAAVTAGTYAYVYCTTIPSADERVYHVVSATTAEGDPTLYYEVNPTSIVAETSIDDKAEKNKVYFIENLDAEGHSLSPKSYTFVQTKVGVSSVAGLFEATIDPADKADNYTAGRFYFDVYNQNNGEYAVKVIKVTN